MSDRLTFDPAVIAGRACVRGLRLTVSPIVSLLANGMTPVEILREYGQRRGIPLAWHGYAPQKPAPRPVRPSHPPHRATA